MASFFFSFYIFQCIDSVFGLLYCYSLHYFVPRATTTTFNCCCKGIYKKPEIIVRFFYSYHVVFPFSFVFFIQYFLLPSSIFHLYFVRLFYIVIFLLHISFSLCDVIKSSPSLNSIVIFILSREFFLCSLIFLIVYVIWK